MAKLESSLQQIYFRYLSLSVQTHSNKPNHFISNLFLILIR